MMWMRVVLAVATGLTAAEGFPPPDADDLEQMPLPAHIAGDPPASGLRYWSGFAATGLVGSFSSVIRRDGRSEVWSSTWDEGGASAHQVIVRSGPSLDRLAAAMTMFDGRLVDDVADTSGAPAPERGITRASMHHDATNGYILLGCVCPDYLPGQVALLPALAISPDGAIGSWSYLGKLRGEPAAEAARSRIWSDGGSILPVSGGWRAYLNGYGQALCVAESADLAGEWRFRRDPQGRIEELLPEFRRSTGRTGCFPTVLRVTPSEWHAWVCDGWPTQAIWHFWSTDGLTWQTYGQQPEITRTLVNGRPLKCLRVWVEDGSIAGLLSVYMPTTDGDREWRLYVGHMPAGAPPR
jgi:hypothetical protein